MIKLEQPVKTNAQLALESLQLAVSKCLDRKRRLGQYAVIWVEGKPQFLSASQSYPRHTNL